MKSMRRSIAVAASVATVAGSVGALILATPFAGDTAAADTDNTGCSTGQLPGDVTGRPTALQPGAAAGDYLWHNASRRDNGWHIAVTHPAPTTASNASKKVVFTGWVHTSKPIDFVEVRDEKNDVVALSGDRMTMTFRFTNYGHIDGVRFRVECAKTVRFSFAADGHELSPAHVFLGSAGRSPASNPFAIERR
jgi:hypothetical protein